VHFLRLTAAILLGAVFLIVAAGNIWIILRYYLLGRRGSRVPVIGGVCGCLALLFHPGPWAKYCWIPLVLDPGCLPMVAHALVALAFRNPSSR
jgi:hypothetical protein